MADPLPPVAAVRPKTAATAEETSTPPAPAVSPEVAEPDLPARRDPRVPVSAAGALAAPGRRRKPVTVLPSGVPDASHLPRPDQPLPTSLPSQTHALDTTLFRNAGADRLGLPEVLVNVRAKGDAGAKIAAIASLGARGDGAALTYQSVTDFDKIRATPRDIWDRGYGECNSFMSLQAALLVESGAVARDDVKVAQTFSYGGWHNVVVFRDPSTRQWTIMDYNRTTAVPAAASAEDALRAYMHQQIGVAIVYQMDSIDSTPTVLYHVRSSENAARMGYQFSPGLGGPQYGTLRGHNDGGNNRQPGALSLSGQVTSPGGVVSEARITAAPGSADPQQAAVSVRVPTGAHSYTGPKIMFYRDPTGGGSMLTVGNEWWTIDGGKFLGVVLGAHTKIDVIDRHGETLSTVAPFVAVSGGSTHAFVDSDTVRWEGFWNAYGAVSVPLVLGKEDRARIGDESNGLSPGGWLEPGGLASDSAIGGNFGTRLRWRLAPVLSLNTELAAHTILTDPTLAPIAPVPVTASLDVRTALAFEDDRISANIGTQYTMHPLFDRDPAIMAWAAVRARLTPQWTLDTSLSGGEFAYGGGFIDARASVGWQPLQAFNVQLGGGATTLFDPGQRGGQAVPNLALRLEYGSF